MTFPSRTTPLVGALAVLPLAVAPLQLAAAQPASSLELLDLSLEQLTDLAVTVASRIPADPLNVAASAVVVPEPVWQRRDARTISDVLETVPGVAIAPALGGADAYAIRGYVRTTSLLGVLLTWDGVPLNDLFRGAPTLVVPSLNLGAVDEMQVVRGPGSALYGADAFHGVVALHAFDGDDRDRALGVGAYSNGFYKVDTRMTAELGGLRGSFAFGADGQSDQDRAYRYVDPVSGDERGGTRANRYEAQSASLKLRGDASSALSWHGGLLLHRYEGDDFQGFGTRLAGTRDVGDVDVDLLLGNGGLRRDLGNGAVLEVQGYAWQVDNVLHAGRTAFDFESATQQSRAGATATYTKSFPARHTALVVGLGAESLEVDEARTRNYDLSGNLTLDTANASAGAKRRIYSATFEGNTTWASERWRLVYGARLDDYSDFGSRLSPRVGLIWHPRNADAVKLLYGNAFRAPTANDVNGTPGLIEANPALEPEIVDTFELVYMRRLENSFISTTLFESRWRDGIVSIANTGGTAPFIFANLERNRSRGLTSSVNWQLDSWLVNVGGSWVESENATLDQDYGAFPKLIVNAEIGYQHDAWRTRFHLVQHWQIDTDDVFPPSAGFAAEALPSHARTDVGATKALADAVTLRLSVRNLLDRDNFRPSSAGTRGGILGEPRSVGLTVRVTF